MTPAFRLSRRASARRARPPPWSFGAAASRVRSSAIGNAPTALFRLLEMLAEGAPSPAAVIGMPVGFVGAAESKEALIADGSLPYLVVRGRRGGSAHGGSGDQCARERKRMSLSTTSEGKAAASSMASGSAPAIPSSSRLKAVRLIGEAQVVAYFAKEGRPSNARRIATSVDQAGDVTELALAFPVTTEIPFDQPAYACELRPFYDKAASEIASHLRQGRDVALICEGDPLFYGSFMHIHARLKDRFAVSICAGITGMSGCWTAAQAPMSWGDDVLTVLPGTLPRDELARRLAATDAAVVMKLGRNLPEGARRPRRCRARRTRHLCRARHHARATGLAARRQDTMTRRPISP